MGAKTIPIGSSGCLGLLHRRVTVPRSRHCAVTQCFFGGGASPPKQRQDTGSPRRKQLLAYVQEVQQQSVQQFLDQHSGMVANAMLQTTQGIVGTLPPQYFEVTINAAGDSLAELMFRVMLTAYMLRNAQYRMELQSSLAPVLIAAGATAAVTGISGSSISGSVSSFSSLSSASWSEDDAVDVRLDRPRQKGAGGAAVLAAPADFLSEETFAPGVQKTRVQGDVLRWHMLEERPVTMAATEYMALLEAQLAEAREQLRLAQQQAKLAGQQAKPPLLGSGGGGGIAAQQSQIVRQAGQQAGSSRFPGAAASAGASFGGGPGASGRGGNELLDYMKNLPPHAVQALSQGASKDVVDAMHAFVDRLMGTGDPRQLRALSSEFSAVDLSKVLVWLMVVGYTLRTMEARCDMEDALQLPLSPGSGPGLLPGC